MRGSNFRNRLGSIYTFVRNYPILTRIVISQVTMVSIGLLVMSSAFFYVIQSRSNESLVKSRERIRYELSREQEELRAWKQLGLNSYLDKALAKYRAQIDIESVDVVRRGDDVRGSGNLGFFVPEVNDGLSDFVIKVKLKSDLVSSAGYLYYFVFFSFLMFLGVSFLFIRQVRKKVYGPIFMLNEAFARGKGGSSLFEEEVNATGEIKRIIHRIEDLYRKKSENDRLALVGRVASQVRHDIQSPLITLGVALDESRNLSFSVQELLRNSIEQIRHISNDLEVKSTCSGDYVGALREMAETQIGDVLSQIVYEKRRQFRSFSEKFIDLKKDDSYGVFCKVNEQELRRVLSNLINNAHEALLDSSGRIDVRLNVFRDEVSIEIEDNGEGIREEDLNSIMKMGFSKKVGGTGLGLYHANSAVTAWNGSVHVSSSLNLGTNVTIRIPRCAPPSWFVPSIDIGEHGKIFILDDDQSVLNFWRVRLSDMNVESKRCIFFTSASRLLSYLEQSEPKKSDLFLLDQEIKGDVLRGSDLIKEYDLQESAILITGKPRFSESKEIKEIQGIRYVSKSWLEEIPVRA